MARDGSGNYSRVVTPPNNGDVADADDYNAELDDVSTALSDSINRSGTKAWAANQSMGGYRLTDVGTPSANTDAATKGSVAAQITAASQPLDATLTALAALSWSSGRPVLEFTAADTVSLTLAPSVTSVTASNGAGASTPAARFTNTTDSADVDALIIEGDRATPANNDIVGAAFYGSNNSGSQVRLGRLALRMNVGTAGSESSRWFIYTIASGTLAARYQADSGKFGPVSNDSGALGEAAVGWSDLFLASGGVIGWGNGLVTLTHNATTDALEVGAGAFLARSPVSTETGGTLTSASSNKIVNLATAPTIDGNVHAAGDQIFLVNNTGSAMTITAGSTGSPTQRLSGSTSTGNRTLALRGKAHVYFISATEWSISGDVS